MSPATLRWVDHGDGLATWIAQPDEPLERASHVLAVDGDRYLCEPVAAVGLEDHLPPPGTIRGVLVLLDRHRRDAAALARRYDAPVLAPAPVRDGLDLEDVPVEPATGILERGGYEPLEIGGVLWDEVALWRSSDATLVVPETVGTAAYFLGGDERVGVHPLRRLRPPAESFAGLDPRRLLVGHGPPLADLAGDELAASLSVARRRLPAAWVNVARAWL